MRLLHNLQRQWFSLHYYDGKDERSESALIFYSKLLPSAIFKACNLAVSVMVASHAGFFVFSTYCSIWHGFSSFSVRDQAAYAFVCS